MTALHIALEKDNHEIIQSLLSCQNIDVNIKYKVEKNSKFSKIEFAANEENTALCIAIEKENIEAIRLLLSFSNIDVNAQRKMKSRSNRELDQIIFEKKYWKDNFFGKLEIKEEKTPLFISVEKGNLEIVKYLISCKNIQPNLLSKSYKCYSDNAKRTSYKQKEKIKTALHKAVEKNKFEIVKELLKCDRIKINLFEKISTVFGITSYYYAEKAALHIAVENENYEIILLLLSQFGININIIRKTYKKPQLSKEKVDYGFEYNSYKKEETALIIAIEKNNDSIVQLLLTNKYINVNQPCIAKFIESDCFLKIMEHLKNKAYQDYGDRYFIEYEESDDDNNNKEDNNPEYYQNLPIYIDNDYYNIEMKTTALNIAIKRQQIEIIKYLLENKSIDINEKSFIRQNSQIKEKSALHLAVETENQKIIMILLQQPKIDINTKDERGKTPIEYTTNE